MSRENKRSPEEKYKQIERDVINVIEGRAPLKMFPGLGKRLDDFAKEIEHGIVPVSYVEKTISLAQRLRNYCGGQLN